MNKLRKTFVEYQVDKEYADTLENYLLHGFEPGGFFTSLLANDAMMAISRSHPANKIPNLKNVVVWIMNVVPKESFGSYEAVKQWCGLSKEERRRILEEARLLETPWELLQMKPDEIKGLNEEMLY